MCVKVLMNNVTLLTRWTRFSVRSTGHLLKKDLSSSSFQFQIPHTASRHSYQRIFWPCRRNRGVSISASVKPICRFNDTENAPGEHDDAPPPLSLVSLFLSSTLQFVFHFSTFPSTSLSFSSSSSLSFSLSVDISSQQGFPSPSFSSSPVSSSSLEDSRDCSFFHFIRLFWNHILICLSLRHTAWAISIRRFRVR